MKKLILLFLSTFLSFSLYSQWQTSTNLTYTTSDVVSIGGSSIQAQYGNPPAYSALEIISAQGEGSGINFKTGNESAFLSFHSVYPSGFYLPSNRTFGFFVNSVTIPSLSLQTNGNISIGTTSSPVDYKLAVGGKIIAEELNIQLQSTWPDYVFTSTYKLPTLEEVEKQIKQEGHLANVPSADEVKENGFEVGDITIIQQEKIEELTLYIIEQNKINKAQSAELKKMKRELEELKSLILKN